MGDDIPRPLEQYLAIVSNPSGELVTVTPHAHQSGLSAVNIGLIMRRERQAPWASPVFPYLGWIILGWILTWAAVELHMLQRLLDTMSLSGRQWVVVLALSLLAPAVVGVDKIIQLSRQRKVHAGAPEETRAEPAVQAAA